MSRVTGDLDHRRRWSAAGAAADHNLDALCRVRHRMKDRAGWSHERDPVADASIWLSPRGRNIAEQATSLAVPTPVAAADLGPPPY